MDQNHWHGTKVCVCVCVCGVVFVIIGELYIECDHYRHLNSNFNLFYVATFMVNLYIQSNQD